MDSTSKTFSRKSPPSLEAEYQNRVEIEIDMFYGGSQADNDNLNLIMSRGTLGLVPEHELAGSLERSSTASYVCLRVSAKLTVITTDRETLAVQTKLQFSTDFMPDVRTLSCLYAPLLTL